VHSEFRKDLYLPSSYPEFSLKKFRKYSREERNYVEIKAAVLKGNPPVILDELNKEVSVLKERMASIDSELASIKAEYSEFITAAG